MCWLAFLAVVQAQQFVFRNYGQTEGLKNLSINAMTMDQAGFLWVATENGVYRFLGSSFQRFGPEQGIAEFEAEEIVADENGTIWVGTDANLYHLNGQRFIPAGPNPIPVERLRRIFVEDPHHLLVVEKGRLFRLEHDEQGTLLSYLPVIPDSLIAAHPDLAKVSSVNVVKEPGKGLRIWLGCGKQICSWPDREPLGRTQPREGEITEWGKEKQLPEDQWESTLLDRSGNLWAAGRKHVMVMKAGTFRFVDRSIPGSDPENIYGNAPLAEDPEGRVLVPAEDGIARWEGKSWRHIGHSNGLQRLSHSAGMVFDAAGDVWLGTHGNGLFHWVGYGDWEGWDDTQGLPSALVWTLQPIAGGRILVGTDAGPAWIDPPDRTGRPIVFHPALEVWPGGWHGCRSGWLHLGRRNDGLDCSHRPQDCRDRRNSDASCRTGLRIGGFKGRPFYYKAARHILQQISWGQAPTGHGSGCPARDPGTNASSLRIAGWLCLVPCRGPPAT